jgi:transposase
VLGIDDLALRRGQRYATIFIDLETHRPVDLVLGREAAVVARWLREHPGVDVIARDRAEAYAQGARDGAPAAVQVADRFHLLQNASAALDDVFRSRRRRVEIAAPAPDALAAPLPPAAVAEERPLSRTKLRERRQRARRITRWEQVRALHGAGVSISSIARQLAIDPKTVRRAAAPSSRKHSWRGAHPGHHRISSGQCAG